MSAKNVETARSEHQAFNRRDFSLAMMSDDCVVRDTSRGLTLRGKGQFKEWLGEWVKAMSDAQVTDATYTDAGDTVVAQFTGTGKNDGPMGPFAPSGKRAAVAFCEIMKFDDAGKISSITTYYDQMSLLAQLGHIPAP